MPATIPCPHCSAELTTAEVLEACTVSISGSGLLRLRCPRCGAEALARLAEGTLEIGQAEVGAGFRAAHASVEPGLYVRCDPAWLDCWHGAVYRRFPVAP